MTSEHNLSPYTLDTAVNEQNDDFITAQLVAFNEAHTTALPVEVRDPQPLHLYARDAAGAIRAGLVGRTHAIPHWLEVSVIWVDEQARGQGIGSWLMREAEREAMDRGCHYARLATSDFQAPGFYEKLGYALYGRLDNCPPGETAFYFWKTLDESQG
jgi:ribosomal protein S18 acetylase RimI-like enzyme